MNAKLPAHAVPLCLANELGEGEARGFLPDEDGQDRLFVVRHGGELHAWRNACPHVDGAPMAWRRHAYLSPDRQHVMCHAHGARFEPGTGLCVHGPCLGQALQRVPLTIDGEGQLWLARTEQTQPIE